MSTTDVRDSEDFDWSTETPHSLEGPEIWTITAEGQPFPGKAVPKQCVDCYCHCALGSPSWLVLRRF